MTGRDRPVCDRPEPCGRYDVGYAAGKDKADAKIQASVDVLRHDDTRQMQPDARGRPRFIRRSRCGICLCRTRCRQREGRDVRFFIVTCSTSLEPVLARHFKQ